MRNEHHLRNVRSCVESDGFHLMTYDVTKETVDLIVERAILNGESELTYDQITEYRHAVDQLRRTPGDKMPPGMGQFPFPAVDAIILGYVNWKLTYGIDPCEERDWDVWIEGYRATGTKARARCLGTFHGDWLRACQKAVAEAFGCQFEPHGNWQPHRWGQYRHAYWGCELFPTEEAARKIYG